jgi:ELWxxDGT repeat protein
MLSISLSFYGIALAILNASTHGTLLRTRHLEEIDAGDFGTICLVADINPNGSGLVSSPDFAVYNNKLYFQADDGTNGRELWVYDGSSAPTMVADINPNGAHPSGSSNPTGMTVFAQKLYFGADDGTTNGSELWVLDGSSPPAMVADINPQGNSFPADFAVFNNKLYFSAFHSTGNVLWVFDGSDSPPIKVEDIHPGTSPLFPFDLTVFDNRLFFFTVDGNFDTLWVYDGTSSPTMVAENIYPFLDIGRGDGRSLTVFDDKLYFRASNDNANFELWVYDGSSAPTMVADINPTGASYPNSLTVFNNQLYFSADDGTNGFELWVYDGSSIPTMVADINPNGNSIPYGLTVFNNRLYFGVARDQFGQSHEDLWAYNGVSSPTLVAEINAGDSSFLEALTVFNDKLYFAAYDGSSAGIELWVLDPPENPCGAVSIYNWFRNGVVSLLSRVVGENTN